MSWADRITIFLPSIVGFMYFITSLAYLYKKDYPFTILWFGYSISQVSLVIIGLRQNQ